MLHIHDSQSGNPTTPVRRHFVEQLAVSKKKSPEQLLPSPTFPVFTTIAAQQLMGVGITPSELAEKETP
jgi:hypothetical protein